MAFPLAVGWADPVIFAWEGKWYFLATNDNNNNIGLFIREADSVAGLFGPEAEPRCILDYDADRGFLQTFWAPEFHVIGGRACILFAVSGRVWGPQCHMMRLKENGALTDPADWEEPVRVRRQDGNFLAESGITLDMTCFKDGENSYLVWSYRYAIGRGGIITMRGPTRCSQRIRSTWPTPAAGPAIPPMRWAIWWHPGGRTC